jgi:hypothetical protein
MALGSTHNQSITEMSTRNLLGGKGWPVRGADNITAICEPIVKKMWEPGRLTTLWAFTAGYLQVEQEVVQSYSLVGSPELMIINN